MMRCVGDTPVDAWEREGGKRTTWRKGARGGLE